MLERSLAQLIQKPQQPDIVQLKQQVPLNAILNSLRQQGEACKVLQTALDWLQATLATDRVLFMHWVDGNLLIEAASQATLDKEQLLGVVSPSYAHYYESIQQGDPLVVSQIGDLPFNLQACAGEYKIRALVFLPLIEQQMHLGAIALHQCTQERQWQEEELAVVKAVARECAIALYRQEICQHLQQEQALNQMLRKLTAHLDSDSIRQEIANEVGKLFAVERVLVFSASSSTDDLQVTHQWRSDETKIPSLKGLACQISDCFGRDNWQSQAPLHAPDYQAIASTPAQCKQLQPGKTQSVLNVVMAQSTQLLGAISIQTISQTRHFSNSEIEFAQKIAEQGAIALANAERYESLQASVQERISQAEFEKQQITMASLDRGEMFATMSHELRAPLASILSFSRMLKKQIYGPLNDKQMEYVKRLTMCGEYLLELVNDLLDLSKIEAGREEIFWEEIRVEEICHASLSLVQEQAQEQGLKLSLDLDPTVKSCLADKRRLQQILVNLLSNAVKFTESGSVTLSVRQTQQTICFAVIDTGVGIAEDDLTNLFQPFYQVKSQLNRQLKGSGLGLALSLKLARLHGGDITVESEVGKGSCFTLHLPVRRLDNVGLE